MARYDRGYGTNASPWWGMGRDFEWEETRRPNAYWGRGYDRGLYGGEHPTFGGYPGGEREGIHYGGRERGFDRGYDRGLGRGTGRGYGAEFASEPFMPEEAYRRHPEYDHPQQHVRDRWPDRGHDPEHHAHGFGDEEVRSGVRERLRRDGTLDDRRIDIGVNDGVVTLRGEVDTMVEARHAWDDAWNAAGVRGVVNHLHVRMDVPAGGGDAYMVQTTRDFPRGRW